MCCGLVKGKKNVDFFYILMPPKELRKAYSNRTVRPSRFVSGAYLLNSKFGVLIHPGMAECHIPFLGRCYLDI